LHSGGSELIKFLSMTVQEHNPEEWLEKYGDYLLRYAIMRLRDVTAAEDVLQETFLAAMKGLERFDGRVEIKYWLRGILRNKIVDHIRKAVREQPYENLEEYQKPDETKMKLFGIPAQSPRPWEFEPHLAYEETEFWGIFRECVDKLKQPLQQAYMLKELEGMSTEEVCKVLEITPNNLWVIIHRARAHLKDCIESKWNR